MPVQQTQVPQPRSPFEDVRTVAQVPPDQRILDANGQGGGRSILSGPGGVNSQGNSPFASSGAELPQLLSDPKGVDFKPYLAAVLASVRRSWFMIMPKNGHRGYVSVQFAITRDGTIRKASFAQQTGDPSMDNTAIMAISQSGPFGPLPVQYHDAEIHVQINFSYNQPRQ
jgi:TonB family protein